MQLVISRHGARVFIALVVGMATISFGSDNARASDTVTRWEHFSESRGCSAPYTRPPFASRKGSLSDSEPILGPFATYFGRSIAESRSQQVWWTVPGSGGSRVRVHRDAFPAFQQVAANLAAHAAQGRTYSITSVGAFNPRTVGGSYQISRHAFGTAIDINPAQNPHRMDGRLITNMPEWFVDAWRDAGFCWGGDWTSSKDAMHFSWIGPGTGFGNPMSPRPPTTSKRDFAGTGFSYDTIMEPVLDRYSLIIAAGAGVGAPDLVGVRRHPDGAVIDVASGYGEYGTCSVFRSFIEDPMFAEGDQTLFMDIDGDSRNDLVVLNQMGTQTDVMVAHQHGGYENHTSFTIPITDIKAWAGADFDADRFADLWVVGNDGSLKIYGGPTFKTVLGSWQLPSGIPRLISAADRDGGDHPELFAVYGQGTNARVEVLSFNATWQIQQSFDPGTSSEIHTVGASDFDGDGRADLLLLHDDGFLRAYVGNTSTGVSATRWFVNRDIDCDDPVVLDFEGRFFDDEASVHGNGIEFIAERRITVGCNPPYNDRFCPRENLTRAQAATFVVRALDLPAVNQDYFVDDKGHVLEGAINRLAAIGITQGCNPPVNDRFCPNREMTRAEFGTFLVRAFQLPVASRDYFTDDDGHMLEGPINALAEAGVTNGCNPPMFDMFCPNRSLTRAEAATFLIRIVP